jgi:glycosyltransferase involved in cell wall biosynthesis
VKVLLLHQHFNTPQQGGAIRSYYLAKALVDAGVNTVVITATNNKNYKVTDVDGIEVHYLPITYHNHFGFYKRSLSFFRFVTNAIQQAGKIKNIDVCYAISVPLTVGLIAKRIKSKSNIPYIFEVGDLWPDAPIQMGVVKNKFLKSILYWLEKTVYNSSESIVALSPAIKSALEKRTEGKKIVHLIPNMADTEFYNREEKKSVIEKKYNVEGKFVISYIGAIGLANGLDYFLESARICQQSSLAIQFIMCGEGAMLEGLKKSANELALKNLTIIPFQNREGVREVMNITDAAFVCYKPIPVLETGSPNKYFDGLAAGKLIIVNFGGWIKEEIEKNACGIFADPQDPSAFVNSIKLFISDLALKNRYSENARKLALEKYSRAKLSESFVEIFRPH